MTIFLVATLGLLLSFLLLGLLQPGLPLPWAWRFKGVVLHVAAWCAIYGLLLLVLDRPWFAMGLALALWVLLIQVNNAKYLALREPFVFQDFEYFSDAIRHPRLYIPFLGWWKFFAIVIAVGGALVSGLLLESAVADSLWPQAMFLILSSILLCYLGGDLPDLSFDPLHDINEWGFVACLFFYGVAEWRSQIKTSTQEWDSSFLRQSKGDLLVIQSESFFDPRPLSKLIRSDVLRSFDQLRADAIQSGALSVPAWGANTVRSEFSLLTGLSAASLGVNRFNPYRRVTSSDIASVAREAKSAGYRTVCIHPYPASFYNRKNVFPLLGFDEFIDISSFAGVERFGPYISDAAVTEKIKSIFSHDQRPVFLFVITMENHGPLHLESVKSEELSDFYLQIPPAGCDDLTIYLRHLRNADRMLRDLHEFLSARERLTRLCWYGDHVPIMPKVYQLFGDPSGDTEYLIWQNKPSTGSFEVCRTQRMEIHNLAQYFMRH